MDEKYSVQINFAKPPSLVKGEGGKMYMTKKKKKKVLQKYYKTWGVELDL